jgi:hypothetical protein
MESPSILCAELKRIQSLETFAREQEQRESTLSYVESKPATIGEPLRGSWNATSRTSSAKSLFSQSSPSNRIFRSVKSKSLNELHGLIRGARCGGVPNGCEHDKGPRREAAHLYQMITQPYAIKAVTVASNAFDCLQVHHGMPADLDKRGRHLATA